MGQPEQAQRRQAHQSEWMLGATNPVGGWEPQTWPIWGRGHAESRVGRSGDYPTPGLRIWVRKSENI